MKTFYTLVVASVLALGSLGQTTAMDFTQDDCNGNSTHLFSELDQGKAIIIEFFMTNCNPCINAGNAINGVYDELQASYPGQMDWYHFGYSAEYDCATVSGWVTSHGYPSKPFTDGSAQVAYYGGFGMPTIVVVAGANHDVIFSSIGWGGSDLADLQTAINDFFAGNNVEESTPATLTAQASFVATTNTIDIQVGGSANNELTVEIFSITGQQVKVAQLFTTEKIQMDASEIANGNYIVHVSAKGQKTSSQISIRR